MPSDKILLPRRMIYFEAVLYLLIAAASFAVGYLIGRGGGPRPVAKDATEAIAEKRVPIEGKVMIAPLLGEKKPDAGAVVIVLPDDQSPKKPLAAVGFRPDDPVAGANDPGMIALTSLGGAMMRTGEDGRFTLFVPRPGLYHILIISRHGTRELGDALERRDLQELGKYFEPPDEVLKHFRYKWIQRKVQSGMEPIPAIEFMG